MKLKLTLVLALVLGLSQFLPAQPIPMDPNVRKGVLPNGFTYYIRKNTQPENKVELHLAINAGSILEDEKQLGLAHFMEHMNFNGTKNFPGNSLVDALQQLGIKFGQHLNAYTGFDQTVYMLPVPLDKPGNLDMGFKVMEDWAFHATLTPEEIEKERGVILEEMRIGEGPNQRIRDRWLPVYLHNSLYAKRLPIGTHDVIANFTPEEIIRFQRDWYRPDLMALAVVGDINVDEIEQRIIRDFSKYTNPASAPKRETFYLPNHSETLIAIEAEPDVAFSQVQLVYKSPDNYKPASTLEEYQSSIVRSLVSNMLSTRIQELINSDNPPFTMGSMSFTGTPVRTKRGFGGSAMTAEGKQLDALKVLLEEAERADRFGFTQGELDRAKARVLASLERRVSNIQKTESDQFVSEIVSNYLTGEPMPGIEWELDAFKNYAPRIGLEMVNSAVRNAISDENRVIIITGPHKEGLVQPTKEQVTTLLDASKNATLTAYAEKAAIKSLVPEIPQKGSIVKTTKDDKLGTTTFTLNNGAKVTYKSTDFKDNEILFTARSLGGASLVSDKDIVKTQFAFGGLTEAGFNNYTKTDITQYLSGKQVSVSPFISSMYEGMSGSSTVKDLTTLMELVYGYFTGLNYNPASFDAYKAKNSALYANLLSEPTFYFSNELAKFTNQKNPRFTNVIPMKEDWEMMDYKMAYDIYKQKFGNAGNFEFYFVGNVDEAQLKDLAVKYLATLPSTGKATTFKDNGYRELSGAYNKVIEKGKDPKSMVVISISGEAPYNRKDALALNALGEIATIKVIETLREKEGGIYGGGASGSMAKFPYGNYSFSIQFPCGPENAQKLTDLALAEVKKFIDNGPEQKDLDKYKEGELNDLSTNIKTNRYWMSALTNYQLEGENRYRILERESDIKALTLGDLHKAAKKYLTTGTFIATLMPEPGWEANVKKEPEVQKSELTCPGSAQVIGNYMAALGGKEKLEGVKTLKMNNSMKMMGMEITGNEKRMAPNKVRKAQYMMGQEILQVFDGEKGYLVQAGTRSDIPAQLIDALKKEVLFDVFTFEPEKFTSEVTKLDGKDYYLLKAEDGTSLYFDVETGLLHKRVMEQGELVINEYVTVDGIKFPSKSTLTAQGQSIELQNSNIVINKDVTEADFK